MHLNSIRPVNLGRLLEKGEPCAEARFCEATERTGAPTQGGRGVVGARTRGRGHGITWRAAATGRRREVTGGSSQSIHRETLISSADCADGRR